jgi:hypothetical protein
MAELTARLTAKPASGPESTRLTPLDTLVVVEPLSDRSDCLGNDNDH